MPAPAHPALPERRYPRRAVLAAAVPLLLAACAPNASPTPALATATASGSAVAGRFALATLIAATPEPMPPTAVPAPTAPRPASTTTIAAVTATPRPVGTAAIVTVPVPVRGTNAPAPSAGPAGMLATYTEPAGGIRFQYPANWRATLPTTDTDRDLTLESPNGLIFSLIVIEGPTGTPLPTVDEVAQEIRDSQTNSRQFAYTVGMLQDATVAGERGKSYEYTFVEQANRTMMPRRGMYWLISRDARVYVFQASNVEAGRPDVEAILNSVMFMAPRPAALATAARTVLPATRTGGSPAPAALPTRAAVVGTASAVTR